MAVDGSQKLTAKMIVPLLILLGGVAMVGGLLCVITKCIEFKPMVKNLDWTAIIVVGGSLGFASCVDESGAGVTIANSVVKLLGDSVSSVALIAALGLLAVIMGNVMTHTATTAILVPITIYIAEGMGINVRDAAGTVDGSVYVSWSFRQSVERLIPKRSAVRE